MAKSVNRSSEWVGNAYLYVMGDPNRKSYARNSKGFEPMENFFPAVPKPDSAFGDSDSDSGTEELVKERHQRLLEAKQRRMDKKKEEALSKQALDQTLREDNRTGNGQQRDLNSGQIPGTVEPVTREATRIVEVMTKEAKNVEPKTREISVVKLITKETTDTNAPSDYIPTEAIIVEGTTTATEQHHSPGNSMMVDPSLVDYTLTKAATVEGNTAHTTTATEQQYSPGNSMMVDPSLPKQFNKLQPSRLDFDRSSSEPEKNTRMAPPLSTGEVLKKTKRRKTFTMPSKRKSRKAIRVQSETSQSDTDTNMETGGSAANSFNPPITSAANSFNPPITSAAISFNPPITSTLNPDKAQAAKSKKKKDTSGKKVSSNQPLEQLDNTDSDSDVDSDKTMQKLLGGALSRLSKYQTLLSRGQTGKSSQDIDKENYESETSIPTPKKATETTKKNRKSLRKSVAAESIAGKKRTNESEVLMPEEATIESEKEPATKKTKISARKSLAAKSAAKNTESTVKKNRTVTPKKSIGRPPKKDRKSTLPKERTPSPPSNGSVVSDQDVISPNSSPMHSPPFNDGTTSVQTTPNDGTSSLQTTPTPSEQPTPISQRKFLKVKRFSIMLTKTVSPPGSVTKTVSPPGSVTKSISPPGSVEKLTTKKKNTRSKANKSDDPVPSKKKPNRKSSVGSSKASSSSNSKKSHTKHTQKGIPETEVEPIEQDSPPVSGDDSVLPKLIRKRKNQTKLSPVKRRKIDQLQEADEDVELTLSPGGRQYRRHKVGPRSSRTPGVRRSRRTKIPPVRPWLGEKVEYEMRRKSGVSLKGYLVPTYDLEEQAPPKTKKSRAKRTTSQEAVTATDDDFEKLTIGDSSYEEEWTVVRTKASAEKIEINELSNIDYYRFYSTNAIAFGVISFQPMAIKESCSNLDHQIVFHITTGRLQFKVNNIEYDVQPGMTVHVPPSSLYRIQNLHRAKAEVFYVAHTVKTNTD